MNKKIIIITGAANGIAKQIAVDLDDQKNVLCLFDIDPKLVELKNKLKKSQIEICIGDVKDETTVYKFVRQIYKKYKKILDKMNEL